MATVQLGRRLPWAPWRAASVVAWLLVLAVGAFTYFALRHQPFYYDAAGYMAESKGISDHGLFSKWIYSDSRSYGYPFFLTGVLRLARLIHEGAQTGVFITQWPLFAGSAWYATRGLFQSRRTRLIAFVAVAANPLLVVYSAQAFTESLTLSCILFAIAAICRAMRSQRRIATALWLAAGAAVSSYAVVVRPGSLVVALCFALAAAGVLLWPRGPRRWAPISATAALVLVAMIVPLIPQVVINHRHYHSDSPLPTYNLSGLQARYGLIYVHYIGNVSTCGANAFGVPNPHPVNVPANETSLDALRYYTTTWPAGPEMVVLHVFSGLDPHPFLIDQHDYGTRYERFLEAFTVALLFLAGIGLMRAVRCLREPGGRFRMDALFVGLVTLAFLGILATSAVEYRFGAYPLLGASLLAALGASRTWRRPRWQTIVLVGAGYCATLLLWVTLSDLLLSTAPQWVQCG
jgi:hypothetical protein